MKTGIEFWNRAKKVIPGGNQIFSKRSERFLPGLWPAYYVKAKGCEIWDLDDTHYYDFAGMGVGTCILGYADNDVNNAVINAVQNGSMATLNVKEEVILAEKLVELHPWADMARFAKSGGEAASIGIRIGRAASGKDRVAFCGYHGWADWYISSNIADSKSLDGQLLPGLVPNGVPRSLKDTALPFNYNKIEELEAIVKKYPNEVGVIIMEPRRGNGPENNFLEKVKEIAKRIGAVLIFDEITSGFRINLGGIHLTMGVTPDITVLGKALGNGYPISAILGTREVMEAAQTSFISSTFWSDRLGFSAAIASLDKMKAVSAQEYMVSIGQKMIDGRNKIAGEIGIDLIAGGIPSFNYMSFNYKNSVAMQTVYIQEMLKRGYLVDMGNAIATAHSEAILSEFLEVEGQVFEFIKQHIDRDTIESQLDGEVRHTGFKRLTG
jgi:glutamate-1-semialdehyde 2,1-aminomutase